MQVSKQLKPLKMAELQANEAHAEAFESLAHLSRLRLFFFLVKARGEVPAGEIQEALEIPAPTLSHHLDILRRAGLIRSRKEARFVYYSVDRQAVTQLVRLLTACC
jgi:DNA-binding transcriptional ArsR family regulator